MEEWGNTGYNPTLSILISDPYERQSIRSS